MKPRVEKKLSKKLALAAPKIFSDAWVDTEVMDSSFDFGVSVSHVMSMCGGVDYFGEGNESCTCLEFMLDSYQWFFGFKDYPKGHEFEGYPDTGNFKPTSRNLLKEARLHG